MGNFFPETAIDMKPLGDLFIKLIKMMIGLVVFCTVVSGIAGMGSMKKVGRVGGKALLYFEIVSTLALLIGMLVGNVLHPGAGFNADPAKLDTKAIAQYAGAAKEHHGCGTSSAASSRTPSSTPSPRATSCRSCWSPCWSATRCPCWASARGRCAS